MAQVEVDEVFRLCAELAFARVVAVGPYRASRNYQSFFPPRSAMLRPCASRTIVGLGMRQRLSSGGGERTSLLMYWAMS